MEFRAFLRALTVPPEGTEGRGRARRRPGCSSSGPRCSRSRPWSTDVEFQYRQVAVDGEVLVYAATVTFEEILDARVTSEALREEV
jgi:hypothetical protein